jgi:hypothetical protein
MRWNGKEYGIRDPQIVDSEDAASSFNRVERAGIRTFGMKLFVRVRRVDAGE